MAILTLSIDDMILQQANEAARRDHTSLNAWVCGYLTRYVSAKHRQVVAAAELVAIAQRSHARSEAPWTRESLHER